MNGIKKLELPMTWKSTQEYLENNRKYRLLTEQEIHDLDSEVTTWTESEDKIDEVLTWVSNGVDVFKASKTVKLDVWLHISEEYLNDLHELEAYMEKYELDEVVSSFIYKYLT